MPTRNRREWLPYAIECFQLQTYANRELVIVADGPAVRDVVPFEDPRITYIWLSEDTRPKFLSEKFNFCCAQGKGEILCKWDDDDWSADGRIADQVARLECSRLAVTGYRHMLFTDGPHWWRYESTLNAMGTSFCFTREWFEGHKFRSGMGWGSDMGFAGVAAAAKQIAVAPAEEMMVASIHRQNTSPKFTEQWRALPGFQGVAGYRSPLTEGRAA